MAAVVLTKEALEIIKDDAELFGAVAKVLDVRPLYMSKLIKENDSRFTKIEILQMLSEKSGKSLAQLVENLKDTEEVIEG